MGSGVRVTRAPSDIPPSAQPPPPPQTGGMQSVPQRVKVPCAPK